SKDVLVLVFSKKGFERVAVEEYDENRRLRYLYRTGPPNGFDATATTGMPTLKKDEPGAYQTEVGKRLTRLGKSITDAVESATDLPAWESEALSRMRDTLGPNEASASKQREAIFSRLREAHPDVKSPAILSVAWSDSDQDELKWVGDFQAFRDALVRKGGESASRSKGIDAPVKGIGQCCICGADNTEVSGLLKIQQFKVYTLDKPGSVSGGFDAASAWRNFPACQPCCDRVDFSGERVKQELSFNYYGFKYLVLPAPILPKPTEAFRFLKHLIDARVKRQAIKKLTDAEDEVLYVISEEEHNLLQFDLLFYQPDPQSFRPTLYVTGLLPSRFRTLFKAKDAVDAHTWLGSPGPGPFTKDEF
ncbi:MAG: TM1802 family CRISPR-associated protein, partial [Acidobacteria bacterium]|nr:TM1802 family CRISPR-associated protein [Acidobacteriota bacterium]